MESSSIFYIGFMVILYDTEHHWKMVSEKRSSFVFLELRETLVRYPLRLRSNFFSEEINVCPNRQHLTATRETHKHISTRITNHIINISI